MNKLNRIILTIFIATSVLFSFGCTTTSNSQNYQSNIQSQNQEVKEEIKKEEIVFETVNQNDQTLEKGQIKIKQGGQSGAKEIKYKVTYLDGKETVREKISENITIQPINKIILNGTKEKPVSNCDPNYSGACVPIASDVDCAGGSGNGPAYVKGHVKVIGRDIYGLDRDGDGLGCE